MDQEVPGKTGCASTMNKGQLAIVSDAQGFWVSLLPADPCDQTFESVFERSAFFPGRIPLELRQGLANLDVLGDGREALVAPAFGAALDAAWGERIATHRGIGRRARKRAALLASGGSERDAAGLSFIHFPDEPGGHWGTLSILFGSATLLYTSDEEFWMANANAQSRGREIFDTLAKRFFAELSMQWGLGEPLIHHSRGTGNPHWAEDWDPTCQSGPDNLAAMAILESTKIGEAIALDSICSKRHKPL